MISIEHAKMSLPNKPQRSRSWKEWLTERAETIAEKILNSTLVIGKVFHVDGKENFADECTTKLTILDIPVVAAIEKS